MEFKSFYSSSAGNLYRVASGEDSLLLECGVPLQKIKHALGYQMRGIHGCLVSHLHLDHARSAQDLMRCGVDVFCAPETAGTLGLEGHRLNLVEAGRQFRVGPFNVVAFDTVHDVPGALGFLISDGGDKLLFAVDTSYIKYQFHGLTHICIECNWSEETICEGLEQFMKIRLLRSHMSLSVCKQFLMSQDLAPVREINLLHLSDRNGNGGFFKREIQKATGKPVYVCEKGMK